jgi:molecular chaperone DnaJ
MSVDIPAGVDTGVRLQLRGQGEVGPAGGPNGDLFLEMKVKHHDVFSRNGDDLLATVEVSMVDAMLGTKATFTGLDGEIEIDIRAGMQSAEVITLENRGITKLRGGGRGDLKIGVQVLVPTKLSTKEQELIRQFAASHKARAPRLTEFQQGLFAKLRDRFMQM